MTRFIEVNSGVTGKPSLINVDHVETVWTCEDGICHYTLSGDATVETWAATETYDEIKALLLAGGAVITEGEG
jgi:hypothetical protein